MLAEHSKGRRRTLRESRIYGDQIATARNELRRVRREVRVAQTGVDALLGLRNEIRVRSGAAGGPTGLVLLRDPQPAHTRATRLWTVEESGDVLEESIHRERLLQEGVRAGVFRMRHILREAPLAGD